MDNCTAIICSFCVVIFCNHISLPYFVSTTPQQYSSAEVPSQKQVTSSGFSISFAGSADKPPK